MYEQIQIFMFRMFLLASIVFSVYLETKTNLKLATIALYVTSGIYIALTITDTILKRKTK